MYDVAIIGCGVIGAATAYALSRYDNKVVILEAENDVADCTTKANSAILHAARWCWHWTRRNCPICSICSRTAPQTACPT